ncbi:hypothetical protein KDN32_03735 [Nocardioides sp. J2M5]|uniref:DUF6338 family protein n=1 Tax=Nocardioides palaemonis TaxID=2829810 RepID=UPI001BAB7827|nr:DUF6338 family protein [Nocardioides palaemonis]MBS2936853.1 hypothetical protein [Nocardioides palaemonis]
MTIPSSVTQLLVMLVLVIPGFVYQAVRIRIVGRKPGDTDLPTRILRAIVISTMFALIYLAVLGPEITTAAQDQAQLAGHPRRFALMSFVAAFVVPTISAIAFNRGEIDLKVNRKLILHPIKTIRSEEWTRYDLRPSAWDVAFQGARVGFVRARMADGTWVAGYYGPNSYASSHPDPQNLFLELAFAVDSTGKIGEPIVGSAGVVIDCRNALVVELLKIEPEQAEPDPIGPPPQTPSLGAQ